MTVVFGVHLECSECGNPVQRDGDGYLCLGCRLRGNFSYGEAIEILDKVAVGLRNDGKHLNPKILHEVVLIMLAMGK